MKYSSSRWNPYRPDSAVSTSPTATATDTTGRAAKAGTAGRVMPECCQSIGSPHQDLIRNSSRLFQARSTKHDARSTKHQAPTSLETPRHGTQIQQHHPTGQRPVLDEAHNGVGQDLERDQLRP